MQPDISFFKVALCKLLSWAWTRVWKRLKSVRSRRGFWSTTSWCTSNSTICTLFATGFVRFFVLSILLANYTLWTALLAASFSLMVLKVVLNHHGKRFQVGYLFENVFFLYYQYYRLLMLIKKNDSIRWFMSFLALPSARSINSVRPVL